MYFVAQSHHQNFDSVLTWFCRYILSESTSSSEWKQLFIDADSWTNQIQWFTQTNELVSNSSNCCHFIFQTTLSSCCFVVRSYHWQQKTHCCVLSASSRNFGRCPAPGKVLALKNIRLCFLLFLKAQRLCFPAVHGHQCQQHPAESQYHHQDLPLQHFLHLLNHLVQYHHRCVCRPCYHHCQKLDDGSRIRLEIVQGGHFYSEYRQKIL